MQRRRALIFAFSALISFVVLALAVALSETSGPATRDGGALASALANAGKKVPAGQRIATDKAHQAVVSEDSVAWADAAGHQYVTPMPSSGASLQLFETYKFVNYRQNMSPSALALILELVGPITTVIFVLFIIRMLKSGGMPGMSLGKSRAKEINPEMTGVTFADVAGADSALLELRELVAILRDPKKFEAIGARTPKGVLLSGPPGTGKTLLAKAVAGEASAPFFAVSGSEFVEMYVGVGASRVRDLFAQARLRSPAIIFIDEIDAVGRRRGAGNGHSNDEREQTLNQLLVELDGMDNSSTVIVIAATNRPDVLDPALLRPGRFDRSITVENPDVVGREAILQIHGKNKPLSKEINWGVVARQTPGFSGADLANLVNESALLAARENSKTIDHVHIEDACLRVIAGPQRNGNIMSEHEREIVAHHEMGHALVGMVLPNADPVHKVSIVSRGRALGLTMQLPERDKVLGNRHEYTDKLAGLLGGRIAEEIIFGEDCVTSGAADDIQRASQIARAMVTELGMSPLGPRHFPASEPGEPRTYSERTAEAIDAEIDHLLAEASDRARHVLLERHDVLVALAQRLLEVETMHAEEMQGIVDGFGKREAPAVSKVIPVRRRPHHESHDATPPRQSAQETGKFDYLVPPQRPVPGKRRANMRRTIAAFSRLFGGVPADS